jgi:hypothetical protein
MRPPISLILSIKWAYAPLFGEQDVSTMTRTGLSGAWLIASSRSAEIFLSWFLDLANAVPSKRPRNGEAAKTNPAIRKTAISTLKVFLLVLMVFTPTLP